MNYKETRMLGVLSTKGNPAAMADIKALLNSLVVVDMRSIKVREIGLQAGYAKTEDAVKMCWTVIHRGAWAGRMGKDYRRSPVTTHDTSQTEIHGSAEKVVEFWMGLGFAVTYDLLKTGYQCLCHNDGFGVDIVCTVMRDMRNGSLTKQLEQCAVLEVSVKVVEDGDVEPAERALLDLSKRLDPVVKMTAAH